jgi:hypothetical protein
MDIRDASESFGEFDDIIAHGVYAWVRAPVRDALMRQIDWAPIRSGATGDTGVSRAPARAYILQNRGRGITDVKEKFAAAKECMEFYAGIGPKEDLLRDARGKRCSRRWSERITIPRL